MRSVVRISMLLLAVAGCGGPSTQPAPSVAASRVSPAHRAQLGEAAPAFPELRWLGGAPAPQLRGKVVLLRFFTNTCPFCKATAPALAELHQRHRDDDVLIIGVYHPKPRGRGYDEAEVRAFTEAHGWSFPVALDDSWTAVERFWPGELRYTSYSVLLDRQGRLRYVHPGPEFHPSDDPAHAQCDADFRDIESSIAALVAEPTDP